MTNSSRYQTRPLTQTIEVPAERRPTKQATRTDLWAWLRESDMALTLVLVLVGLVAHGLNMFNYPAPYGDEGIYTSQAWAVLREGRLTPYTYWYDHAPLGWLMLA